MSAPRAARVRAAPARFAAEQEAAHVLAAAFAAEAPRRIAALQEEQEVSSSSSEEDEEEEKGASHATAAENAVWSDVRMPVAPHRFRPAPLRRAVPPHCTTPLDFFHLFCPPAFISSIVEYTNTYAEQRQRHADEGAGERAAAAAAAAQPAQQWQATNEEEVRALLGCLIYMGIACMDATTDYWAATTRQAFVADTFPRHRFLALLRRLRFNGAAEVRDAERDPLHHLRRLIDLVSTAALDYFSPGEHQTVDEAMVGCKGRSSMRQHVPGKAEDTGFKVWMLVDSSSNFVVAFDIYTGAREGAREENASANVVLQLVDRALRGRHHVIVMDNYFTSVHLLRALLEHHQYAVGTARSNRKQFPRRVLLAAAADLERGGWKWRQHRQAPDITAVTWMDKKLVNFLSSCTDPTHTQHVTRREGSEQVSYPCPSVLPLYTQHMRGVDVFSQRRSYSKLGRRSRKFFYSLIWFLVDVAIHNAYILYQQRHNRQHYSQKDFRKQLMQQLVDGLSARKEKGAAAAAPKRTRDALHALEHAARHGDCVQCRPKLRGGQHGRQSHWRCGDCNVFLCLPDCYNKHVQAQAEAAAERAEAVDE